MSDEALLILKMVQEGKITPEQGVAFLEAVKRDAPGDSPAESAGDGSPGHWRSLPHAQRVLAQLQQQLAEMQAKLGAAQAGSSASSSSSAGIKLPFGMGGFNVTSILDEAMRGVGALRNEAIVSAKRAARQAQKEARRFRVEAERLGKNIHVEVRVRTDDRPRNVGGYPQSVATAATVAALPPDGVVTIRNSYGDVKVVGRSSDGSAHIAAEKTVWAATQTERDHLLAAIEIEEVLTVDGRLSELAVAVPAGSSSEEIVVNITVEVPSSVQFAVATTFGDVHCESLERSVSRIETTSGAIRMLHIHDGPSAQQEAPAPCAIETASGAITIAQWRGTPLAIRCESSEVQLDMIDCPGLTLQASSGDARARGLTIAGDLRLDTKSGDLVLSDSSIVGACAATTQSGDLSASDVSAGSLSLETASGDARAVRTDCGTGRAVIKAISGDLGAEDVRASEVNLNTTSGDVDAAFAPGFVGSIAGATVSGDLTIGVSPDYSARLTLNTHSGELKCALPLSGREGDGEHYLTGLIGNSSAPPTAMLQSVSGDLCVRARA